MITEANFDLSNLQAELGFKECLENYTELFKGDRAEVTNGSVGQLLRSTGNEIGGGNSAGPQDNSTQGNGQWGQQE
jgi:hypothetical protein